MPSWSRPEAQSAVGPRRRPGSFSCICSCGHDAPRELAEAFGASMRRVGELLVTSVLAPMAGSLLAIHPQLKLELVADTRHLNLARREADIALRPRRFEQRGVVQRATGKLGFAVYAAHGYLAMHGPPVYADGRGHTLIAMSDDTGDVARSWLSTALPYAIRSVKTNGRDAMVALARSGAGLACLARVVGDAVPEPSARGPRTRTTHTNAVVRLSWRSARDPEGAQRRHPPGGAAARTRFAAVPGRLNTIAPGLYSSGATVVDARSALESGLILELSEQFRLCPST